MCSLKKLTTWKVFYRFYNFLLLDNISISKAFNHSKILSEKETESALQNESKSQLISKSGEIMSAMDRAQRRALSSFTLHHVPADFQSEIVPSYSCSVFTIEDFSRMRNNADPIYSPPLVVDGLKWRLKV